MAHFSELDSNNKVLRNIVINNDVLLDENNIEQEQLGIDFCHQLYGSDTIWVQCSYNNNFRNVFPIPERFYYFENEDVFMPPKMYDYFVLKELVDPNDSNNVVKDWLPEVDYPDPTFKKVYNWNHESRTWDSI